MLRARPRWLTRLIDMTGPFLGLAIVLGVFSWINLPEPDSGRPFLYLSSNNIKQVAVQSTVLAVCGIGMTMVIITGGIDLSIGSVVALSNVVVVLALNGEFMDRIHRVFFWGNDLAAWSTAGVLSVIVFLATYRQSKNLLVSALWVAGCWLLGWLTFAGQGGVSAFCAGTLVGLVAGWINGLLVTQTRVVPFIITLGTMEAFRGITLLLANNDKVDVSAEVRQTFKTPISEGIPWLVESGENAWLDQLMAREPTPAWLTLGLGVWLMVLGAIVAVVVLARTRLGRYMFAIGSNEEAGRLSGLAVPSIKRWVYSLSGLSAGIAGVLQFSRISAGVPTDNVGLELDVIAAVVIGGGSLRGGEGSILGTLIGAFILGFMRNGCTLAGIPNPVQRILIGSIIVLAVALDEWRHGQRR